MRRKKPKKLAPREVTHLAFEGGGGKGGAYLGALAAMSHPDVNILVERDNQFLLDRNQINGVAGTSAGSITAAMLVANYSLQDLAALTIDPKIKNFFEPPGRKKRYCPIVRRGNVTPIVHDRTGEQLLSSGEVDRDLMRVKGFDISVLIRPLILELIDIAPFELPFWAYIDLVIANLIQDYGVIPGTFARSYISRKLTFKTGGKGGRKLLEDEKSWQQKLAEGDDMRFRDLKKEFGGKVKLAVYGADVETGRVGKFTTTETPEFKVADAIRISMGIPLAFKPVRIPASEFPKQEKLHGLWVDGGLLINYPLHAFDKTEGKLNPGMLGFRLEEYPEDQEVGSNKPPNRAKTEWIHQYVKALLDAMLNAASNREVRAENEKSQTVNLPVGKLDTFTFAPARADLRDACVQSAAKVFAYFRDATGQEIGVNPDRTGDIRLFLRDRLRPLWPKSSDI